MPTSVRNQHVERRAQELIEVIQQALREKERLEFVGSPAHRRRLLAFLQNRVWPTLPKGASGRWTRAQEERLVGYGKRGEPA